ncbi:MAG: putative LPS assembly protein LptD [Bacteroidales bacterium]
MPRLSDSLVQPADTLPAADRQARKSTKIESRIDYEAEDSLRMDFSVYKAYLYGNYTNAQLNYQQIELKSGYVEMDFRQNQVYARGFEDSAGVKINEPEFTEGERTFTAREMYYNLETRQGFIRRVVTNEGEGYLLGDSIKKLSNDHINISSGSYTTCNHHDAPHYEIYFRRAKVIPKDKIITGPAFLRIEGIPTPLILPFGFFPNKKGQASGILIPTYGETANMGFFLQNGGYYFGINDHVDLALRGDIYSRGSWGLKAESVYKVRYRYQGRLSLSYAMTKLGDPDATDYEESNNFFVRWSHGQEPGSRPNSRFSANVNAGSSNYNDYNSTSVNDYLTNTYTSSINYSTQIAGLFNLSAAMSHNQNTKTKEVQMKFPDLSVSTVRRIYPFRLPGFSGKPKWYQDINLNYTMISQNSLVTYDSLIKDVRFRDFNNGIQHTIPIQSNINLGGWLNINNTFQYTERWYFRHYDKQWNNGTLITPTDTFTGYVQTDTIYGFKAARNFGFTSTWNTSMYGFYDFTRGPVTTVRHVMKPSLSFNYTPDFAAQRWGYYRYYMQPGSQGAILNRYSIFETLVYGSPPAGRSGRLGLSVGNTVEMKVRQKEDTLGLKKVVLIEGLNVSTGYDVARDSLNWSPLSLNAYTTLFKNFRINVTGAWDPYQVDSLGRRINRFEYARSKRFFRRTNSEVDVTFRYQLSSKEAKGEQPESAYGTEEEIDQIRNSPESYIDWNNPWSFSITYSFKYASVLKYTPEIRDNELIQTVGLQGDFNLTPKWKVEVMTGYDFAAKDLSFTRLGLWRDLHCWDLAMEWIPSGPRKSYMLTIKVKSAVLQDLKLTRKSDWRDNV